MLSGGAAIVGPGSITRAAFTATKPIVRLNMCPVVRWRTSRWPRRHGPAQLRNAADRDRGPSSAAVAALLGVVGRAQRYSAARNRRSRDRYVLSEPAAPRSRTTDHHAIVLRAVREISLARNPQDGTARRRTIRPPLRSGRRSARARCTRPSIRRCPDRRLRGSRSIGLCDQTPRLSRREGRCLGTRGSRTGCAHR